MYELQDWNPPRVEKPAPHLSRGRYLEAQRYVVGWPEGIVKVGNTDHGRQRWGTFLCRGGMMLDLAKYERLVQGLEAEIWLEKQLAQRYDWAFTCKEEAEPYLGNRGGGWTECFKIPPENWPEIIELARTEHALVQR
jgi:hypothetical protein